MIEKGRSRVRALLVTMVVITALFVPAAALADNGDEHGKVVFGSDYVLEAGKSLYGDLAVLGGDVAVEPGSVAEGNLLVMGGGLTFGGRIDGDIVVFGGDANLEATAEVDGDVIVLGGDVEKHEDAVVTGTISEGFSFDFVPHVPVLRPLNAPAKRWSWWDETGGLWALLTRALRAVGSAMVLALLALLVVALWPRPVQRVADTVWSTPGASLGVGVLTFLVVPGLLILLTLLVVTLCVVPILVLLFAVTLIFGWVALGLLVGRRFLHALRARDVAALWEASLGVLVISLVGAMPCMGWLAWFVGGAFGLGAVILTRFGTRSYQGDTSSPVQQGEAAAQVSAAVDEESVGSPDLGTVELSGDEQEQDGLSEARP